MKEEIRLKKIAKMTVTDHLFLKDDRNLQQRFSYGHLSDFLKSDFLFHIHLSVVICDFLVISSYITIVPMHVSFKIYYRNNLIVKKDSYLISRPPYLGLQLRSSALPFSIQSCRSCLRYTNRNYSAILATLQITSYVHSRNPS
jgi:hypothetical protein